MKQLSRRQLLRGAAAATSGATLSGLFPSWAQTGTPGLATRLALSSEDIRLRVGHSMFNVGGRSGHAITINGVLPAPLIRLREGQTVRLHVENGLR